MDCLEFFLVIAEVLPLDFLCIPFETTNIM